MKLIWFFAQRFHCVCCCTGTFAAESMCFFSVMSHSPQIHWYFPLLCKRTSGQLFPSYLKIRSFQRYTSQTPTYFKQEHSHRMLFLLYCTLHVSFLQTSQFNAFSSLRQCGFEPMTTEWESSLPDYSSPEKFKQPCSCSAWGQSPANGRWFSL